jgi:hypothetical protein
MMMLLIFITVTSIFCGTFAQYADQSGNIPLVGGSLTWTHSTSMGAYRIIIRAPVDSLIQATCNIVTNCQTQSFVVSRSGETDLTKDGQRFCGNYNLPPVLSIGNEIVVALNARPNEGATFRCVFTSIAQTDANCDCGWRKSARIAKGTVAGTNEFVSHVGFIYTNTANEHDIFCGGVICKINLFLS